MKHRTLRQRLAHQMFAISERLEIAGVDLLQASNTYGQDVVAWPLRARVLMRASLFADRLYARLSGEEGWFSPYTEVS